MEKDLLIDIQNMDVTSEDHRSNKYGITLAAVFIVGTMCGSGLLAIPQAMVDAGWTGIPVLAICGLISAFTGNLLGKCWRILRSRYPEYNTRRITDPYPTIALHAAGKAGEYATRISIDVTLFGGATVFVLLISGNISNILKSAGGIEFSLCYVLLITMGFLTPLTWLGTPKDFWQAGVIAAVSTSIGALLIVIGVVVDGPLHKDSYHPNPTFESFFNAFGTILYAFGGASCFPTIQLDMREPEKFEIAVVVGILAVLVLYLPAGMAGFMVFGNDMKPNVLSALSAGWISYTINILITSHLLMAFVIISNPVAQEIEGFLRIPDKFSLKRVIIRTIYSASVFFVALTIPHFDIILALVGGSTVACTCFIFPPLFYLLLAKQEKPMDSASTPVYIQASRTQQHIDIASSNGYWIRESISLHKKVTLIEIIVVGIAGGISSTYFAFAALVSGQSEFTMPCYMNASVGL